MFKSGYLNFAISSLLFSGIGYLIGYIHAKRKTQILTKAEFYLKPGEEMRERFFEDINEFITITSLEQGKIIKPSSTAKKLI